VARWQKSVWFSLEKGPRYLQHYACIYLYYLHHCYAYHLCMCTYYCNVYYIYNNNILLPAPPLINCSSGGRDGEKGTVENETWPRLVWVMYVNKREREPRWSTECVRTGILRSGDRVINVPRFLTSANPSNLQYLQTLSAKEP